MVRRLRRLLACCLLLPGGLPAHADPALHWHSASGLLADGRSYCALKFDQDGEATLALRYDAGSDQPTLSLNVAAWPVQVDRPTFSFDRAGTFVPLGESGPVGLVAPISMADLGRFLDPAQTLTLSTPQWPTRAVRIDMQPGDEAIQNFRLCVQLHQPPAPVEDTGQNG
ncbi:hypothetical protein [Lichenicoccus roseus]|uniref:Uncharacterized protein n=1 Tax=Lichenicoccus roseus TaxID=2683649 RepID=A0A5R9J3S5_9PROT|nr:hypothetical protein [Lichenicoccus roseus]TLU71629.1 hypothetical protein FE263_14215 [Lichenicoccus roseus]